MNPMLASLSSFLLILGPLGILGAQASQSPEPKLRSRLIGRTALPDGTPWADCEIRLFSRPLSDRVDFGKADLVTVRSSSKGRWHAKLLLGRSYMAWAHAVDDKGRHWFGQAAEQIVAGDVLKFIRAEKPVVAETLILKGRDRWKALGPFSFRLRFGSQDMEVHLEAPDEKGILTIHPIPYANALLIAKTAAGQDLFVFRYERSSLPIIPKAWNFAIPHPLALHVQDEAGPVKGARVSMQTFQWGHRARPELGGQSRIRSIIKKPDAGIWAEIGRTDANGDCDLLAHKMSGSGIPLTRLRIQAEGRADKLHVIRGFLQGKANARMPIVLEKALEVHGRILWKAGVPAALLPFLVVRKVPLDKQGGSNSQSVVPSEVLRTDADGKFSFSFLRAKTLYRIVTTLDEQEWARLSPSYPGLRLPSPYVLLHQARSDQEASQDLGDLSLDKMVAVDLMLEGARRDRQGHAIVILKNTMEKASIISEAVSVLNYDFDAKGRACFLLPPGTYDSLTLHPKLGSNQVPFQLGDPDRGAIFKRQVQMEPYHTILVTVTDGQSKPYAGVKLSTSGGGYTHLSKLCTEIYAYNGKAINSSVTDEEGIARIRLIAVKSQHYSCQAQHPKPRGGRSSQVKIDTNNLPETLELELSR